MKSLILLIFLCTPFRLMAEPDKKYKCITLEKAEAGLHKVIDAINKASDEPKIKDEVNKAERLKKIKKIFSAQHSKACNDSFLPNIPITIEQRAKMCPNSKYKEFETACFREFYRKNPPKTYLEVFERDHIFQTAYEFDMKSLEKQRNGIIADFANKGKKEETNFNSKVNLNLHYLDLIGFFNFEMNINSYTLARKLEGDYFADYLVVVDNKKMTAILMAIIQSKNELAGVTGIKEILLKNIKERNQEKRLPSSEINHWFNASYSKLIKQVDKEISIRKQYLKNVEKSLKKAQK